MTDEQTPNPTPPEEEKTQPRKRLRRLLEGSDQNQSVVNGEQSTLPEGIQPENESESPVQPEPPDPNLTTPTVVSPRAVPPVKEQPDQQPPAAQPIQPSGGWHGMENALPFEPPPDQAATRVTPVNPPPAGAGQTQPLPANTGRTPPLPRVPYPNRPERQGPPVTPPPYGPGNTPLPRRVEEVDPNATRVTPAAYYDRTPQPPPGYRPPSSAGQPPRAQPGRPYQQQVANQGRGGYPPSGSPPSGYPPSARGRAGNPAARRQPARPQPSSWKRGMGCLLRGMVALLFLVVFVIVAMGSWVIFQYYSIASKLPSVDQLQARASQFETTRILDRNGDVLYEIIDPNAGRRTYVPLSKISPYVVAATIATEDKGFYSHPGFDPFAIARAFYMNITSDEVVSGASTITQQLARALLLPNDRYTVTYERKINELVLASEITRRYTKDQILELYLNENYYGNFKLRH